MLRPVVLALAVLLPALTGIAEAQNRDLRTVFTAPIAIERSEPVTEIPIDFRFGKLFIAARVNGEDSEFIFDTGSPTILSRALADTLDLVTIGQNTGVDANGTAVTMDVAIAASIELGGVRFIDVPVLVFDYSGVDPGGCIFTGGVIGSEILPGSAWRIDMQRMTLGIAESTDVWPAAEDGIRTPLHDFGYPHAPVIDYSVGDISDRALFDTGSPDQVALFARVAEHESVLDGFVDGSVMRGRGYEGVSAGGSGDLEPLIRATLSDFRAGSHQLGPVRASVRGVPPTLLGAGILDRQIVTLDYPAGQVLLAARSEPAEARREAGYGVQAIGGEVRIMRVFDGSHAASAGLEPGARVLAIGDRSLTSETPETQCDTVRWLLDGFDPADAQSLLVDGEEGPVVINVPATE
ncbi:retropepsin-like aspartic protease [Hyphobacterium marinum]|uniref:Aspartyl protease family protein n=1 Tax=Hyphobacterium marinum TaxID=3116574 RepID=A0ABU7M1P5_9PROT|nr:aspartyl protease family protein [Hyphobacterium sp. Y6023]MEE2567747.1 aspartyl protease family protein [Hyphobacterium sp. Y6023]